jgi:hypothetical protein
VSTADTPERPQNVFTEEPAVAAAKKADQAVPGEKPGQTSADSAPTPDKPKRKPKGNRRAERKFAKLRRELEVATSENTELKGRLEALENAGPAPTPKPEPQLREFKTPREYADAVAAWVKESKPAPKPTPKPEKPKPSANTAHAEDLKTFAADGNKRLGDKFTAAFTNKDLAINQVMGEFMLDSDLGPELMVYLHEHEDEAKQIWLDKPEAATERLEAIEAALDEDEPTTQVTDHDGKPERDAQGKFVKKPDPEPKPTIGTKSNAPPAPGDSERGEVVPATDLEKAEMDDYSKTRRKQYADRGERV